MAFIYQVLHFHPELVNNVQTGSSKTHSFNILLGTNIQWELTLPPAVLTTNFLWILIIKERALVKSGKAMTGGQ